MYWILGRSSGGQEDNCLWRSCLAVRHTIRAKCLNIFLRKNNSIRDSVTGSCWQLQFWFKIVKKIMDTLLCVLKTYMCSLRISLNDRRDKMNRIFYKNAHLLRFLTIFEAINLNVISCREPLYSFWWNFVLTIVAERYPKVIANRVLSRISATNFWTAFKFSVENVHLTLLNSFGFPAYRPIMKSTVLNGHKLFRVS
jgi:hypothetical protein